MQKNLGCQNLWTEEMSKHPALILNGLNKARCHLQGANRCLLLACQKQQSNG